MKKEYRLPIIRCEILCPGMNMMVTVNPSGTVQEGNPDGQYIGFGSTYHHP